MTGTINGASPNPERAKRNHVKLASWNPVTSQIPVISKGKPSIVPNVPEIDIISSTISLCVCVSGSAIAAGLTVEGSGAAVVSRTSELPAAWLLLLGARCRILSQWSRHMSATSQSSSSLTRRSTERKESTLARHDLETSGSVVSRAHLTSNVAVDVRWNALSEKLSGT